MLNTSEQWDSTLSDISRQNITELNAKIARIFARNNLAIAQRALTNDTTLDYSDSVILCDTSGGGFTVTLQYANSWSASKSPIIAIVKSSTLNTLTLVPQSGDNLVHWTNNTTVTGNITSTGVTLLVSDGISKWFVLAGIGGNVDPYYAHCRLTSTMSTIGATELKVTPLTASLSGFTKTSDILTCTQAGYYKLEFNINTAIGASGEVIYIGYRINGGTTLFSIKYTGPLAAYSVPIYTNVFLALALNDTVEFRVVRASGANNATLYLDSEFNLTRIAT